MKTMQFNNEVGATAGCTLRLLLDTIPQEEKSSSYGIRGNAWFGRIKTANAVEIRGHEAVLQIKQCHSLFPKEFIEPVLKEAQGGVHILLEGTTQDEVPLVALSMDTTARQFYILYLPRMLEALSQAILTR